MTAERDTMHAHIEPIAGVIRIYEAGKSRENRDEYVWAATVRWLAADTIEIIGVDKAPTTAMAHAIKRLIEDEQSGIRRVKMRRHGQMKERRSKRATDSDGRNCS